MKNIDLKESQKILKMSGIDLEKKHLKMGNKIYSKNEYLSISSSFKVFTSENINLYNSEFKHRIDVIYHLFLVNVLKFTKLGLILPCFVFLLISLISFSSAFFYQNKGNFGFGTLNGPQIEFLYFVSIFMFLIFAIYLYLICVKKEVIYYTKKNGQNRLRHISKAEFFEMLEIFHKNIKNEQEKFNILESERLKIRQFNYNDKNDVFEFLKNDMFIRFLNIKKAKNEEDALTFIYNNMDYYDKNLFYKLAIELKSENKVIGFIGLSKNDLSKSTCQVIYGINEPYWGQGYVLEALKIYMDYLKNVGMKYIFAGHVKENVNSGKVMTKYGFIRYPKKDYQMQINGENKEIISYIYMNDGDMNEE